MGVILLVAHFVPANSCGGESLDGLRGGGCAGGARRRAVPAGRGLVGFAHDAPVGAETRRWRAAPAAASGARCSQAAQRLACEMAREAGPDAAGECRRGRPG